MRNPLLHHLERLEHHLERHVVTVRNGLYGVYRGRLYELAHGSDGTAHLISENAADLGNGFEPAASGYVKRVPLAGVAAAYRICTTCSCAGLECGIAVRTEERLLLRTPHASVASCLGFGPDGDGGYEKWVGRESVEITEKWTRVDL